jgi:DNA-binding MarR family transcriptional regulator
VDGGSSRAAGLAQRVASKHDRRVRLVVLTKKGAKIKNALAELTRRQELLTLTGALKPS